MGLKCQRLCLRCDLSSSSVVNVSEAWSPGWRAGKGCSASKKQSPMSVLGHPRMLHLERTVTLWSYPEASPACDAIWLKTVSKIKLRMLPCPWTFRPVILINILYKGTQSHIFNYNKENNGLMNGPNKQVKITRLASVQRKKGLWHTLPVVLRKTGMKTDTSVAVVVLLMCPCVQAIAPNCLFTHILFLMSSRRYFVDNIKLDN